MSASGPDIGSALVIGEALMDVRRSGTAQSEVPGGSPANVALGLARLGHEVRFLTSLGPDDRGSTIARHLRRSGVQVLQESFAAERTSIAIADIDASGAAAYSFDLAWALPSTVALPEVEAIHIGSIASFLRPGADVTRHYFRSSSAIHKTFDPNVRPKLLGSQTEGRAIFEEIAAQATLVKLSDEDAAWLYPGRDVAEVARRVLELGSPVVAVTLGAMGALLRSRDQVVRVAAPVVPVVDTIGAGDTFMVALIDRLLGSADCAEPTWLHSAGHHAVEAAAITVGRAGADLPSRSELDDTLAR